MRRGSDQQPELVEAEPSLWRRLTGLFDRSSDAVIVNRRPVPAVAAAAIPAAETPPTPAPAPQAAVPLSQPEAPVQAPAPTAAGNSLGDDFLINAWKSNQSDAYDRPPGGVIGGLYQIADSPVGDWIYKSFLKPRRRR